MIPEKDLQDAIKSRITVYREGIRDAFKSLTYGTQALRGEDFAKWFALKVQDDPFWFPAMTGVDPVTGQKLINPETGNQIGFPEGRAMAKRFSEWMEAKSG